MIVICVLFAVWYAVALLRVLKKRMHRSYLQRATFRTCLSLTWMLVVSLASWAFLGQYWRDVLPWAQLVIASVLFLTTVKTLHGMKPRVPRSHYADAELPTVTVAIPARNETDDLQECLRSVLANTYPKLEVIVLDDCSQTRTADIIKSFAHDGVRFIPGVPPTEHWLAKNLAYETLYQQASGDIVLFCGVDIRFEADSIRHIVDQMLVRHKRMVSVMPVRLHGQLRQAVIQPIRYWWEIALPRKLFNRPSVLSSCWAVYRQDLRAFGGFRGLSQSIIPEQFIARQQVRSDGYSFLRTSSYMRLQTTKTAIEQFRTAIRVRYPELRRRPERVLAQTGVVSLVLFLPFVMAILGCFVALAWWPLYVASGVLLILTHGLILQVSDPGHVFMAITFPVAALMEVFVSITSMAQYEFFTVTWKDRNICIPVMHVYPKLPTLSEGAAVAEPSEDLAQKS